jgi:hypothetical protein
VAVPAAIFAVRRAGPGVLAARSVDEVLTALATRRLPCTGVNRLRVPETKEDATCSLSGETLVVAAFRDPAQRDRYLTLASGAPGSFVVGGTWTIQTESPKTAERIRAATGGRLIRPGSETPEEPIPS